MYRILSISYDLFVGYSLQSLLETSGYTVIPAAHLADASALIRSANLDAVLLGNAIPVRDRTRLALLGVSSNIPVVCMCGLPSDYLFPVRHVPPTEPRKLLRVLAEVLGWHYQSAAA